MSRSSALPSDPPDSDLVLVAPPAATPIASAEVASTEAATAMPLDAEVERRLRDQARRFVEELVALEPAAPAFTVKVTSVHRMGDREIRASAAVSNRLLDAPTRALRAGPLDPTSTVAQALVALRRVVGDLDPAARNLAGPKKLLGVVPFGNRLRDYFASYRAAQAHLDGILRSLMTGQEALARDNAAIDQEKQELWSAMGRLREYVQLVAGVDGELATRVEAIEATDPDRARALRQDVLFAVRQKHTDLLTQLAVSAQGYLALDLVRRNNSELIRGVERARTTTVAALRVAVFVAQALADQKLVLDQIGALNEATDRGVAGLAELLRSQTTDAHPAAGSPAVSLRTLRAAFADIYATVDAIDSYRIDALETMRATVADLTEEVGKANSHLERVAGPTGADELTKGGGGG